MMAIFSEFIEECLEVLMDDFSIFEHNFVDYLDHHIKILKTCILKRLVLSWEKYYFE